MHEGGSQTRDISLNWDVFVTPAIPTVTSDLPPGSKQQMWSPISSTLIYGKRDTVLVDAPITVERARRTRRRAPDVVRHPRITTVFVSSAAGDRP